MPNLGYQVKLIEGVAWPRVRISMKRKLAIIKRFLNGYYAGSHIVKPAKPVICSPQPLGTSTIPSADLDTALWDLCSDIAAG